MKQGFLHLSRNLLFINQIQQMSGVHSNMYCKVWKHRSNIVDMTSVSMILFPHCTACYTSGITIGKYHAVASMTMH
jgi:hypothetical protein